MDESAPYSVGCPTVEVLFIDMEGACLPGFFCIAKYGGDLMFVIDFTLLDF